MELTEDDYRFLPVAEAKDPAAAGFFMHYVDSWWLVHPDKGLAFFNPKRMDGGRRSRRLGAAQCNTDERVTRKILASLTITWPVEVRQIKSVWVPADPGDYQ